MDDTGKYLIHAEVTTDGVVERSDVVGAIFGQTEGLLGDDLDLRDLQQTSRVGRIDVSVESEGGQSTGDVTIVSQLDKAETAILAASLETIDRVGPCVASFRITAIEDVREAKRREIIARAKELLSTAFDEDLMGSTELVEEVREAVRVERITEYEGLPAGPRVANSDAIIVVEGRSDVLRLLKFGIKNAIAVEGTNVPAAVADLTRERTVTAFLDGDRGGELILRELDQVGEVDYVAFAPAGRSVEDLPRHEVLSALRDKVPYELAIADGAGTTAIGDPATTSTPEEAESPEAPTVPDEPASADEPTVTDEPATPDEPTATEAPAAPEEPATLAGHVRDVIGDETGTARLLDAAFGTIADAPADEAFETLVDVDPAPAAVVFDGTFAQRLLDVAAQRGIEQVVARDFGEFTKQPTTVRLRRAAEFVDG